MIGGDPAALRALARRVRDHGDEIAQTAARVRTASDAEWHSTAADRFREVLDRSSVDFGQVGDRYEHLAERLEHLATTLESRQQLLVAAFNEAREAFDKAQDAVEDGARAAWDYAGDVAGFARDRLGWLS